MADQTRQLSRILSPVRWVRRHPWLFTSLVLTLIVATAISIWQYARFQFRKAEIAVFEERSLEAEKHLALCLKVWPNDRDVLLLAARTARRMGKINVAETYLNRCLELKGGATNEVQCEFYLLRVQAGEVDELAPALFDLVEKGHQDYREILNTIARTYILRLRYKPAYACLSKWIEVEPGNAKPLFLRGWVLERLNNQKAASQDYQKALEVDPDLIAARLRVAEMLLEDKQGPDALPHLERLMKQSPNDPQVQARMGICQFLLGNAEEARRLMEAAVPFLDGDPALHVALANLDLQDGRAKEAEAHLRTVLKGDPSDSEALFVLVSALQIQGRTEESAKALEEYNDKKKMIDEINLFLKDKADNPGTTAEEYAGVGTKFIQIGRQKLGVYWLEKALEIDPGCQTAHKTLANHYEKLGDSNLAATHRLQIRGATPDKNTKSGPQP